MDALAQFMEGLTIWHWLVLGIVLMTLEVAVGTFDLFWVATGAFLTALFILLTPSGLHGWQAQLSFFGLGAIAFVVAGRTWFKGLRMRASTHPHLNDRLAGMVGQAGHAASDFEHGQGKVKVGDTVWLAHQAGPTPIREGDRIVVSGADHGTLKVKPG